MGGEVQFARINLDFNSLFKSGGYFSYDAPPPKIKDYMDDLNKDIRARNNAKIEYAKKNGLPAPKRNTTGPPIKDDELENEHTTCAIQVSHAFNVTDHKAPGISFFRNNPAIPGGNGYYIQNVAEMEHWLTTTFGETADIKAHGVADKRDPKEYIMGKKGILIFGKQHVEFWNGSSIIQDGKNINAADGRVTAPMGNIWVNPRILFWEIRAGGDGKKDTLPEALQGWWTVYDGKYYYYYFQELPYVVYTETRPAGKSAPPPKWPKNQGKVSELPKGGWRITWNVIKGEKTPTVEDYYHLHGTADDEMNGFSNKYGQLFARKMRT
jgi:hypothetical protein